jgi:hypothetical protein
MTRSLGLCTERFTGWQLTYRSTRVKKNTANPCTFKMAGDQVNVLFSSNRFYCAMFGSCASMFSCLELPPVDEHPATRGLNQTWTVWIGSCKCCVCPRILPTNMWCFFLNKLFENTGDWTTLSSLLGPYCFIINHLYPIFTRIFATAVTWRQEATASFQLAKLLMRVCDWALMGVDGCSMRLPPKSWQNRGNFMELASQVFVGGWSCWSCWHVLRCSSSFDEQVDWRRSDIMHRVRLRSNSLFGSHGAFR